MANIIICILAAAIILLLLRNRHLARELREQEQRSWEKRQEVRRAAEKEVKQVKTELAAMRADRDKYRKIAYGMDRARLRLVEEKKGKRGAHE